MRVEEAGPTAASAFLGSNRETCRDKPGAIKAFVVFSRSGLGWG